MKLPFLIAVFFLADFVQLSPQPGEPLFSRLSAKQTGISFINPISEDAGMNVLAYEYFYNGGGVAAGDINHDGLIDLFFTANIDGNRLYLNQGNFQFKDISRKAKVTGRKDWTTGVTMADVNGDGWLDIYVCYSGKGNPDSRRNELYINNRDLTFSEKAAVYGLDDPGCTTQAVFFDYDIDGDLDCYILNHNTRAFKNVELHYLKKDYDSLAADKLYRNDGGKFIDVSKTAGISGNPISFGLGVAVSDINNDGWPDIYVSNDYTEQDYCYINNRNGSFSTGEYYMFSHQSHFSMGSDVSDINNDGLVDILTLDMLPEDNRRQKLLQGQENYELYQDMATNGFHYQFMRNMLQLNNGNGTFSEIGQLSGISNTDWSWAPLVADFDNDGWKDIFITNGYMRDYTNKDFLKFWGDYLVNQVVKRDSINYLEIIKMMPVTLLSNYAFQNNGNLTFTNVSGTWGLQHAALSNGAAYADLDNDGDLDIVVNNINAEASVYRNNLEKNAGHHFLKIKLDGAEKNSLGLGAKLYCYSGGTVQFLEQMPSRGYQSSVSEILHFGLGKQTLVDSVKIVWLDGSVSVFRDVKPGQLITAVRKDAKRILPGNKNLNNRLFTYRESLVGYSHLQIGYNDFKRQPLMPVMYSNIGPCFATADVNGDGRTDLFIGSSQGQSSEMHLQQPDGSFMLSKADCFMADSVAATADILFFDADGDKDQDIYAVSGGYHDFMAGDSRLQDRLFINDGKGNFSIATKALPAMYQSKSCVAAADIDADGDADLFVGGRVVPGSYPEAPESFLLINDGKGNFKQMHEEWAGEMLPAGMVTDARWTDISQDGKPDLIVVGEWMAPSIYINSGGKLVKSNDELEKFSGWWNTLEVFDFDHDGDQDFITGNWGLNSQFRCNQKEPLEMYYKDFDNNGSVDPFLCCYIQGKSYPYISRDELLDQMYIMRKKFTSYQSYADATIRDIFSEEELKTAKHLAVTSLETMLFENREGRFYPRPIPLQAQFSPVYKMLCEDVNADGFTDIILFGNNEYPRLRIGKMDACFGTVLMNDGKGNFRYAPNSETGLFVPGDTRDAAIIQIKNNRYLLAGINNSDMLTYKLDK